MKDKILKMAVVAVCGTLAATSCNSEAKVEEPVLKTVGNPYLPLWEHIPDGEPYVFDDPDNPGKQRYNLFRSQK